MSAETERDGLAPSPTQRSLSVLGPEIVPQLVTMTLYQLDGKPVATLFHDAFAAETAEAARNAADRLGVAILAECTAAREAFVVLPDGLPGRFYAPPRSWETEWEREDRLAAEAAK